ncbi:hypothetical protein [Anaeromyxobacter sp. SG64]|uniref:hypothetical protein n=1 Tax=Anaeromyxobacter sp. SG64 TaxID=2925409 RepID=UPI001F591E93|nr:hypothetical protein [Anaeromyxobacter sp. SG64]
MSVLSYAGEVRVGVRSDAAVLAEPADLVGRIEAEAAALGVRGPRPPRPPRPTASGARARARAP